MIDRFKHYVADKVGTVDNVEQLAKDITAVCNGAQDAASVDRIKRVLPKLPTIGDFLVSSYRSCH